MTRSSKNPRAVRLTVAVFATFFISMTCLAMSTAAQGKELSLADILIGLRSKKAVIDEKNKILADAVEQRGITFELTPEIEKELGTTGARPVLISAIREKTAKAKKDPAVEVAAALAGPKPLPVETKPAVVEPKPLPPPPDFAFYRERATKSLKANDLDAALQEIDKATEFKPDDPTLFADRGVIHLRREQNESALQQFSKAVARNPNDAVSYFNLGLVKERLGKVTEALADYEKSSALDPADTIAKAAVERIKKVLSDAAAAEASRLETERLAAERAQSTLVVSVGPLNSYATRLAMPIYPPLEKRMGIQGTVTVLVGLDIAGKVTSAKAVDGPKQLWAAAEYAAKNSQFKPIEREGKRVLASGSITYKFSL